MTTVSTGCMKIVPLEQGTPGWLEWRKGGVGASDAPILLNGTHFNRTFEGLLEQHITGCEDATPRNEYIMNRGKEFEPLARTWYERRFYVQAPPVCVESTVYPFIRASLDGWLDKPQITLEIKYADKDSHRLALDDKVVTPKYTPQLLHQCLATGSPKVHYVSGNPRFDPHERMALVPFKAAEEDLLDMLTRLCLFWELKASQTRLTFTSFNFEVQGRKGKWPLPEGLKAALNPHFSQHTDCQKAAFPKGAKA